MKKLIVLILFSSTFNLNYAYSKVLNKSISGFSIEINIEADAPIEKTYHQFLNVGDWWNGDHSWFGSAKNFYIEPKVGGCFCEVDGKNQVQHATVVYIVPNKEVRMLGGLGPLQMMAVNGAMSWSFKQLTNSKTLITHRYTVAGYYKDGLDNLASVVDDVQTDQVNRLVNSLSRD